MASDTLLMHFSPTDNATKVSRATPTRLARHLGCKCEPDVVRYALLKVAGEILPTYEPNDGPLTAKQMAAIKKASPQSKRNSVCFGLFDLSGGCHTFDFDGESPFTQALPARNSQRSTGAVPKALKHYLL
jgi:hypothetical protein